MKKLFSVDEGNDITNETFDTEVKAEKVEAPTPVEGVVEIKPEPKKSECDIIKIGKVTATSLNIRADANLAAPVVRVVPINTELKIIDETSDFFYVEGPDNTLGFCKKDFIAVK